MKKNLKTRKVAVFFTTILFICIAFTVYSSATDNKYIRSGTCGENLTWVLDISTGKLKISGKGEMEKYNYSPNSPWYDDRAYIKSIDVENGVTSIGDYAFYNCIYVESVKLPNTLIKIGEYAFYNLKLLNSIDLPNNIEKIGQSAFIFCKSIESIKIPNKLQVLEKSVFSNCYKLNKIVVSASVKEIMENAFASNAAYQREIDFLGDMPKFDSAAFTNSDNTTIYYHCNNKTWDKVLFNNFGGTLKWSERHLINDYSKAVADKTNKTITAVCSRCNKSATINVDWICCLNEIINIGVSVMKEQTFTVSCEDNCGVKFSPGGSSGISINGNFNGTIYTKVSIPKQGLHHLTVKGSAGGNALLYSIFVTTHNNKKESIAATCTESGKDIYTCTLCGNKEEKVGAAPLGHNFGKYVSNNDATCIKNGTETAKCTRCNKTNTREAKGSALGHKPIADIDVEPDCVNPGKTGGSHCSVCGVEIEPATIIPAKGHAVIEDKGFDSTCTKNGKTDGMHCSDCKTIIVEQKVIAKKPHLYRTTILKANATKKINGQIISACAVCKSKNKVTIISYPKTIQLSYKTKTYNGKKATPKVVVKDSNGKIIAAKNYTVTYKNNIKVGKATVIITFKGNQYTGKIIGYFTIQPQGTSIKKISAGKKAFDLSWKKQANQTTGYEIQYSTSKKFTKKTTKTKVVTSCKTTKATIGSCKKNTTYYVRIRTYKTIGNQKYYSAWQKGVMKVKTR
ncbi:MAG: leucine-rich repeat domain-containing protein [Oscillospiraceae bacterium]|nr:leucine-rich repeat domain-containing protein [Oscillospiraceae bacterium]